MNRILSAMLLLAAATGASGQDYRCRIQQVVGADQASPHLTEGRSRIGEEFTVDRHTGIMGGALKNSYIAKPQVVDLGNHQNAYKVVNAIRGESARVGSIYALTIDEQHASRRKPFVFLSNAIVYLGECGHI